MTRACRRLAALLCFFCAGLGWAVEPDMARVNVLQELGRPLAAVARGNTEVLTYNGGVRITLKDGRVTEIAGLRPAEGAAEGTKAAAAEAGKAEEEKAEPAERPPTKAELEEQAKQEKLWAAEAAKNRAEMEKNLTDLENLHGRPPGLPQPAQFNLGDFLIGLALKWVLTLAALKLTCKYWGCEVFWSGLMTVAAVDVGIRAAIGLVGFQLLKATSLFYADEALAAVAMVLVLRKVSINQSLAQAVQITMTTKVFSIVVGSFLIVLLLHLLH